MSSKLIIGIMLVLSISMLITFSQIIGAVAKKPEKPRVEKPQTLENKKLGSCQDGRCIGTNGPDKVLVDNYGIFMDSMKYYNSITGKAKGAQKLERVGPIKCNGIPSDGKLEIFLFGGRDTVQLTAAAGEDISRNCDVKTEIYAGEHNDRVATSPNPKDDAVCGGKGNDGIGVGGGDQDVVKGEDGKDTIVVNGIGRAEGNGNPLGEEDFLRCKIKENCADDVLPDPLGAPEIDCNQDIKYMPYDEKKVAWSTLPEISTPPDGPPKPCPDGEVC